MRKEDKNYPTIADTDLKEAVVSYVMAKVPNGLQRRHIYNNFSNISPARIDEVIAALVEDERLATGFHGSNVSAVFEALTDEHGEQIIHLAHYTGKEPLIRTTKIGSYEIPRLLDNTRLAAEDVNQLIEAVAAHQDTVKQELKSEVEKSVSRVYTQMITIFGVFVSILAILVISTDKMLRFDVGVLKTMDAGELFWKSFIMFVPVGFVIAGLVFLVTRRVKDS